MKWCGRFHRQVDWCRRQNPQLQATSRVGLSVTRVFHAPLVGHVSHEPQGMIYHVLPISQICPPKGALMTQEDCLNFSVR